MNNKIPRDARAFAQRVKMGSSRQLWLLVEGKSHDRSFYDRLLADHQVSAVGYSVRLAEQIELNGVSAGGKKFVQELHSYFSEEGLLAQENSKGPRFIVLAMDTDFEEVAGTRVKSDHVLYTKTMDVEAEIVVNADLRRAVSSAYSLPRDSVPAVLFDGRHVAEQLAELWRRWISHGAVAACCGLETEVRFSQVSKINQGGFGPCDETAAQTLDVKLQERLVSAGDGTEADAAKGRIDAMYLSREHWRLVKGRWLTRFVAHLLTELLDDTPYESGVNADTLAKTCIETLDFTGEWVNWYHEQIDRVLSA